MKAEPETNMNKFTAALLVLPMFAIACGSEPTTTTDTVNAASVTQALGEGEAQESGEESPQDPEVVTIESEDPEHLALSQGDAGAPEPQAEEPPPIVGDAGAPGTPEPPADDPTAPAQEPVAPTPACVEAQTRCAWSTDESALLDESAQGIASCVGGEWALSTPCDFACSAGACVTCTPGDLFFAGNTVRVCSQDAQIRIWTSPEPIAALPENFVENAMSLPVDIDPPRSIRMRYVAR